MTDEELRSAVLALLEQCDERQRNLLVIMIRAFAERMDREEAVLRPFHQYRSES